MKRARSIHTSTLDQAILFQYLHNGNFEKYIKRARNAYKRKYELAVQWCREHIPFARLSGYGGLHLFIELHESLAARDVLSACVRQGVVFTPGDIFIPMVPGPIRSGSASRASRKENWRQVSRR